MTEWEVFGTLAALVAFVISIVSPIIKLNTTVTKLTTLVEQMAADLGSLTERNAQTHDRIFKTLDDHGKRITVLETKEELKGDK